MDGEFASTLLPGVKDKMWVLFFFFPVHEISHILKIPSLLVGWGRSASVSWSFTNFIHHFLLSQLFKLKHVVQEEMWAQRRWKKSNTTNMSSSCYPWVTFDLCVKCTFYSVYFFFKDLFILSFLIKHKRKILAIKSIFPNNSNRSIRAVVCLTGKQPKSYLNYKCIKFVDDMIRLPIKQPEQMV